MTLTYSNQNSSQKLKFTADDTSFVNDGITLAYYMSLAGETKVKGGSKEPSSDGTIGVVKVKLLPSNAESKPKAPIEPNKELQDGVKNILSQMGDKNGAQVADVEELSKKLGKLAATSMNFATVAGSEKASDPEDLTESQWARILANNRALHGYYLNGASGIMRKTPREPLPPFPLFYVHDEADVEVTETQNAFQTILARQGFIARRNRPLPSGITILAHHRCGFLAVQVTFRRFELIDLDLLQQECLVNMHKFIKKIDIGVADHLSSPGQRLRLGDEALANRIRDILRQVFASGGNSSMGRIGNDVKAFFESESFTCEQYNAALDEDEEESKWEEKKSWKELTLEEKCNVGSIAYQLGVIKVH
ncbi:hypothetical protein CNMCM8980_004306 [Aspergillus fumigatiaffinis]|nr:hypothetical protein CNMCM8980_004306 [Aspergillus fumigatiaffinis]